MSCGCRRSMWPPSWSMTRRREPVGAGVEAARRRRARRSRRTRSRPLPRLERDPGLVGVGGSVRVGMADAAGADDDLDVERLARARPPGGVSPRTTSSLAAPDREEVDRQDLVLEELLDPLLRLRVSADEGQRRVGGGEEVVVEVALLVAELVRAVGRQVAVAAGLGLRRIVEGPHRPARDARVVPGVVVVLAPHPAVAVQRRDQRDLVAGRAELGRAHERLQERLAVERGLHPDQEPVDRARASRSSRTRTDTAWTPR